MKYLVVLLLLVGCCDVKNEKTEIVYKISNEPYCKEIGNYLKRKVLWNKMNNICGLVRENDIPLYLNDRDIFLIISTIRKDFEK